MTWIPVLLATFQSVLEFGIWKYFIRIIGNDPIRFVARIWGVTYFYQLVCYLVASFISPGYLNASWLSHVQDDPTFREEPAENGEKNFCEHCCLPRPSRAHHCQVCKKCVLLMDHHCLFIDNCIGYRNYKAFYLFLLIYILHTVLTLVILFNSILKPQNSAIQVLIFVISLLFFGFFGVMTLNQLFHQTVFLVNNSTWVENSIFQSQKYLYDKAGVQMRSPYNMGLFANIQQRFGDNPLLWIIPIPNNGNPYVFPKNKEFIPIYDLQINLMDDYIQSKEEIFKMVKMRKLSPLIIA